MSKGMVAVAFAPAGVAAGRAGGAGTGRPEGRLLESTVTPDPVPEPE